MPGQAVKGTTITFGTQGLTLEMLNIQGIDEEVGDLDQTHIGSSYGLHSSNNVISAGEATINILFDGTLDVEVGAANETITIDYGASGKTRSASGYIKSYGNISGTAGDKFTADIVVMFSGVVTKVIV